MIEFLSNFFFKYKFDNLHNIPSHLIRYDISTNNIDEKIRFIINDYKDLKPLVIVYSYKEDIKYFLSIFTMNYCNIKNKAEFEDILLMNNCIFL